MSEGIGLSTSNELDILPMKLSGISLHTFLYTQAWLMDHHKKSQCNCTNHTANNNTVRFAVTVEFFSTDDENMPLPLYNIQQESKTSFDGYIYMSTNCESKTSSIRLLIKSNINESESESENAGDYCFKIDTTQITERIECDKTKNQLRIHTQFIVMKLVLKMNDDNNSDHISEVFQTMNQVEIETSTNEHSIWDLVKQKNVKSNSTGPMYEQLERSIHHFVHTCEKMVFPSSFPFLNEYNNEKKQMDDFVEAFMDNENMYQMTSQYSKRWMEYVNESMQKTKSDSGSGSGSSSADRIPTAEEIRKRREQFQKSQP